MFHAQNGAVPRDMELILNPGGLEFPAAGGTQRIKVLTTAPADELEITIQGAGFSRSVSGYDISVTAQNLGPNVQKAKNATLTVKYRDTTVSATISQEANFIESLRIGGGSTSEYLPATLTYSAAGGSNPFTGWAVYTSGAQACITTWNSGDWTVSDPSFTKSLANGILTVSGEYRGTTAGAERKAALTVNLTSAATDNKPLKAVLNLTQEANEVVGSAKTVNIRIATTPGSSASNPLPASGGRIQYVAEGNLRTTYTSGGYKNEGFTPTISGSADGFTVDQPSSAAWYITAANRGTTVGPVRSITVTASSAGATSKSVTVYQAENQVESVEIRSWGDVDPVINVSARGMYDAWYSGYAIYSSTSRAMVAGSSSNWSTSAPEWLSFRKITSEDASVDVLSRGTTVGSERHETLSFKYSGRSASITITQAENRIEAYSDYRLDAPAVELGYRAQSYADVMVGCTATARYSSGDSQSGAQIPVACNFPDVPVLSFTGYSGPGGAAGQTYYKVTALSTNSSSAPYEFEVQMVYHPDSGEDVVLGIQRIVQAAAAAVGPGTLQLQTSIGTFPRTGYYLVFRFGAADIAADSVSVDMASQRITVPENTVSELIAGGAGAPGDIDILLFESAGSSDPVHTGRITQGQLRELKNGTDILITVG